MNDIDRLATMARSTLWLRAWQAGIPLVKIAVKEGLTVRRIQAGITDAALWNNGPDLKIKFRSESKGNLVLRPLFPIAEFTPKSPCPLHPGKNHPNPKHHKWRSSLTCMVCHRSGRDNDPRLWIDPRTAPKKDPVVPPKPAERETRKARRAKRFAGKARSEKLTA